MIGIRKDCEVVLTSGDRIKKDPLSIQRRI